MLRTTPEYASILDLAYPVPQFEPLRLASRFSAGTQITKAADQVTIHWDRLGASRTAFAVPGGVSATVTLKAAADKKSVIMACRIENHSGNAVRQVLFPDLGRSRWPARRDRVPQRRGRRHGRQIVSVPHEPDRPSSMPGTRLPNSPPTARTARNVRRSMFFGRRRGFAFFPRRWVWEKGPIVMLQYWERNDRLRMMCCHYVNLAKGNTWQSCDYCLTPYSQGRAEADAPCPRWLKEQPKRP